jgi:hypothetical protein
MCNLQYPVSKLLDAPERERHARSPGVGSGQGGGPWLRSNRGGPRPHPRAPGHASRDAPDGFQGGGAWQRPVILGHRCRRDSELLCRTTTDSASGTRSVPTGASPAFALPNRVAPRVDRGNCCGAFGARVQRIECAMIRPGSRGECANRFSSLAWACKPPHCNVRPRGPVSLRRPPSAPGAHAAVGDGGGARRAIRRAGAVLGVSRTGIPSSRGHAGGAGVRGQNALAIAPPRKTIDDLCPPWCGL